MLFHRLFKVCSLALIVASVFCCRLNAQGPSFKMPQGVSQDLRFGMPLAEFKEVSNMLRMREDRIQTERKAYFQPSNDPDINAIIYYFDKDLRGNPLYQIIIRYEERKLARKNARQLFGTPNYTTREDGKLNEWRMSPAAGPPIWAWAHKTTLVIVGNVPGTEWSEEWNE